MIAEVPAPAQAPAAAAPAPLKVFISYAHGDDAHRKRLLKFLSVLVREGVLEIWHDRRITAGQRWAEVIDVELAQARIFLLLVSENFLASEYCYGKEFKQALALEAQGRARVVPVILRTCDWRESSLLGALQAFPQDGAPILEGKFVARRYQQVVDALRVVARDLRATAPETAPPDPPRRQAPPRKPFWRRPLPWWLAGGLALLTWSIWAVIWLERAKSNAREELRIDRPDQAQGVLSRVPEPLRQVWPGFGLLEQVADLSQKGSVAGADSSRLDRQRRELLKQHPADPDLLHLQARASFIRKDLDGLIQAARQALQADPRHAATHSLLGLAADVSGDAAQALAEYRQAAELAPDVPQFAGNQARALLDLGKPDEALLIYQGLPDFGLAAAESALAYWSQGQLRLAERSLVQALDILTRAELAAAVTNRYDWTFIYPLDGGKHVNVTSLAGKDRVCYVDYQLAITRHLLDSASSEPTRPASCADQIHLGEILEVIDADLCRYLAQRQPSWTEAAQKVRRGVLNRSKECVLPIEAGV